MTNCFFAGCKRKAKHKLYSDGRALAECCEKHLSELKDFIALERKEAKIYQQRNC